MPHSSHLIETPIYRCVSSHRSGLTYAPLGRRIAKHVPTLVDNIWEYLRPVEMPSRRSSAFGSPTPALASRFGPANGIVRKVFVTEPCSIVQLLGCPDAGLHEDIDAIPAVIAAVGPPDDLMNRLSSIMLHRSQTSELVDDAGLSYLMIAKISTFWQQCAFLDLPAVRARDAVGEIFFEAPGGYELRPY
jgi:hypothetical protein